MTVLRDLEELREAIGELPYIRCPKHGLMLITAAEYRRQMMQADDRWACPHCGAVCWWVGGIGEEL